MNRGSTLCFGSRMSYSSASRELCLTLTEFDILWRLAGSSGAVLSWQDLTDDFPDDRPCRAVDVSIRSLRPKQWTCIHTGCNDGDTPLVSTPSHWRHPECGQAAAHSSRLIQGVA